MKDFIIRLPFLFIWSFISGQEDPNKKLVENFLRDALLPQTVSTEKMQEYFTPTVMSNPELVKVLLATIKELNPFLSQCNSLKVEFKDSVEKQLKLKFAAYDKYDLVYYVFCGDTIATAIIVENNRIISFFSNIRKRETDMITPCIIK